MHSAPPLRGRRRCARAREVASPGRHV